MNASDCHNIIANKRLNVLQQLSDLKKEEESVLKQIKENESITQTQRAEAQMLTTSLAVTTSSIQAQKRMKEINDNQVTCNVMDFNVDDEVKQLRGELEATEDALRLLLSQLESDTNPEMLAVIASVQEASAKQKTLCDDLAEARTCVQGNVYVC